VEESSIAMTAIWKFRLLVLCVFVFVGGTSAANLVAEIIRPAPPPLPLKGSEVPLADQISSLSLASTIAPFRSDLEADYAVAMAGQAMIEKSTDGQAAQDAIGNAFRIGPHDSRLWLVLALLQARRDSTDPHLAESLKMSYLTGPNRAEIISARLETATAGKSLNDSDLAELARGDVRAMLSQRPGQRLALVNDYVHASDVGKKFLEESVTTIDPGFVDTLRSAR
jgi:hypothetical protein